MKKVLLFGFVFSMFLACSPAGEKKTMVLIETDMGNMKAELFNSTPQHKANFIKLANEGYYDDLLFHRVIKGFMVQGGDPQSKGAAPGARLGSGGPGYTVPAEIGGYHFKGALSAARQGDQVNPQKNSSGSQFYVVHGKPTQANQLTGMSTQKGITYSDDDVKKYSTTGGTPFLDNEYTVFGQVVEGLDVIDKIANVQTAPGDRPLEDVKMKISVIK